MMRDEISEEQRKYKDRILYENLLLQRINAVLFALDNGYSPIQPLQLLYTLLLPNIRSKIKDKLAKLNTTYQKEITQKKLHERSLSETGINGRGDFKTYSQLKKESEMRFIMQSLQVIIDELDERGLLISKERRIEEGGEF